MEYSRDNLLWLFLMSPVRYWNSFVENQRRFIRRDLLDQIVKAGKMGI